MMYLYNFIYAFISTIGFAIIFNVPKASLVKSGFGGALGWTVFVLINNHFDTVIVSTFIASLIIAFIGEIFAILDRQPITVYIIPGIVPLVPGFGLYYTMLYILEENYPLAAQYGSESILIAVSISGALTIVLSLNSYRKQRQKKKI
ncbi:MAG: threonine/serine exporter family protein [Clostridiaceae bacterium]|nr:threonine/serine exporter family protein [Clostridiaceae bacterium]